MGGGLDRVFNDLKKRDGTYINGDYGILQRFLTRTQNGIRILAVLDSIIDAIQANGGMA